MALTPVEESQARQLIAQEAPLLSLAASEATIISKLGATKVNLSGLPAATVIADADLLLIRQGLADKGVAASALKTYAGSPDASTTVKGIVELATNAETITGTDTTRAVTPAGAAAAFASIAGYTSTGDITMSGAKINFAKGADIASAITVNLAAATGNTATLTGTVAVTGWSMTVGQRMTLLCAAATPLTYNATSNRINGGASVTTAVGDFLEVYDSGAGVYVTLTKASGTAVVAPVATPAATQAEMEAASSLTAYVSPGIQKFHPGTAKAWIVHNAGTVVTSYNINALTRNSAGDYTYTFITQFSSSLAVGCVATGAQAGSTGMALGHQYGGFGAISTALRWRDASNGLTDPDGAMVVFYGDQ